MDSKDREQSLNQVGRINEKAFDSFNKIKSRMKLNMFREAVLSENYPQQDVDVQRIQELLDHPEQNDKFKVPANDEVQQKIEETRKFIDDIFDKINALGLPNELSLVVGLLVSGNANPLSRDLAIAHQKLSEYVLEVAKHGA